MPTPELERYLRRATWGLPRARRKELRNELEEHALERAHRLTLLGLSPPDALKRALRDLGPSERVGAGMSQVYLMPVLIRSAAVLALGLTIGLNVLTSGTAQKDGSQRQSGLPVCTQDKVGPGNYLPFGLLKIYTCVLPNGHKFQAPQLYEYKQPVGKLHKYKQPVKK